MMLQFKVLNFDGNRRLTVVDTSNYDSFWGFRRFIKNLE